MSAVDGLAVLDHQLKALHPGLHLLLLRLGLGGADLLSDEKSCCVSLAGTVVDPKLIVNDSLVEDGEPPSPPSQTIQPSIRNEI